MVTCLKFSHRNTSVQGGDFRSFQLEGEESCTGRDYSSHMTASVEQLWLMTLKTGMSWQLCPDFKHSPAPQSYFNMNPTLKKTGHPSATYPLALSNKLIDLLSDSAGSWYCRWRPTKTSTAPAPLDFRLSIAAVKDPCEILY
ncbi:unnamed protein product [Natator depressus]